jgi:hypothetical protein
MFSRLMQWVVSLALDSAAKDVELLVLCHEEPDQGSEHGTVGPVQTRPGVLSSQDCVLMT